MSCGLVLLSCANMVNILNILCLFDVLEIEEISMFMNIYCSTTRFLAYFRIWRYDHSSMIMVFVLGQIKKYLCFLLPDRLWSFFRKLPTSKKKDLSTYRPYHFFPCYRKHVYFFFFFPITLWHEVVYCLLIAYTGTMPKCFLRSSRWIWLLHYTFVVMVDNSASHCTNATAVDIG